MRDPMFADNPEFDPMADPPDVKWTPDPFAIGYGPGEEQPIEWKDPRGPRPPLTQFQAVTDAKGMLAGLANRHMLEQQKEQELAGYQSVQDSPSPQGQGPASLADLMAGMPMYTGGGSTSVTNAVIGPQAAADFRQRMSAVTDQQKGAIAEQSSISQAMHRDVAAVQRERAAGTAAMMKAHEAQRATLDAKIEARMADNARVLELVKQTTIDPDRIYKGEGGSWKRFAHAIAAAMGTFGAGLQGPGARPVVLDVINAQIDRDMKAQMADLGKKKFVHQAGRNLLADLYASTNDLEKSFLLGKMVYTDIAKAQVDALTHDAQSEQATSQGQLAMAALDKAQLQNEMQLKQLEYRRVTRTSSPGQLSPAAQMAMKAIIAQRMGQAGMATKAGGDKASVSAKTKVEGALESLLGLKRVEKALAEHNPWAGPTALTGKATRKFRAVQNPLLFSYTKAMTGVAGGEQERARYAKQFVLGWDATGVWGERSLEEQKAKLDGVRQQMLDTLRTQLRMYPGLQSQVARVSPDIMRKIGFDPAAAK